MPGDQYLNTGTEDLGEIVPMLLGLLDAPDGELRTQALKTLRQMPLSRPAWLTLAGFVFERLHAGDGNRPDLPETYIPRQVLIETAGRIPLRAAGEELVRLVEEGSEGESRQAAHLLARGGEAWTLEAVLGRLTADLEHSESAIRAGAAADLVYLIGKVPGQVESLRGLYKQERSPIVRFWLAVALAKGGDPAPLVRLLRSMDSRKTRLPQLEHDPGAFIASVAERGPYPGGILSREIGDIFQDGKSNLVFLLAGTIDSSAFQLPSRNPTPDRLPAPLQNIYQSQAEDYISRITSNFPKGDAYRIYLEGQEQLRYLPPGIARRVQSDLFARLALSEDKPGWAGDLLVLLADNAAQPFSPDLAALYETYTHLAPYSPLSWQLAWCTHRADPQDFMQFVTGELHGGDRSRRLAALRLVEQEALYDHSTSLPVTVVPVQTAVQGRWKEILQRFDDLAFDFLRPGERPVRRGDEPKGAPIYREGGSLLDLGFRPPVMGQPATPSGEATAPAGADWGDDLDFSTPGDPGGGSTPPDFNAYPDLAAPDFLSSGQTFSVEVGFRQDVDPNLERADAIHITAPQAGESLKVCLAASGADMLDGICRDLPLDPAARVGFSCRVRSNASEVKLAVQYRYHGQTIAFATRTVLVFPEEFLPVGDNPSPQSAGASATPPARAPSENPYGQLLEQSKKNPCRMQLPGEGAAPDLEITVTWEENLGFRWAFAGKALEAAIPDQIMPTGNNLRPEQFAGGLINDLRTQGFRGILAEQTLLNVGQQIANLIPPLFFELVRYIAGRQASTPTILFVLDELHIPWELARFNPPLDQSVPAFLGAQTVVGRWILNENISFPPQTELTIGTISAVASLYGVGSDQRKLEEALKEQSFLQDTYHAKKYGAVKEDIIKLIQSGDSNHLVHFAVHGHTNPEANEAELLLSDKNRLPPGVLMGAHECGEPTRFNFVFLNACQVGTANTSLGQAAGFPGVMVAGGVQGFIAPLWEVHDVEAREAAENFYKSMFEDGAIAGAYMRQMRSGYKTDGSTTAMAYLYYGHPCLRLKRKTGTAAGEPANP